MEDEHEEVDVEVTEIGLSEDEIDEWIARLQDLKDSQDQTTFELDDETELVVNYDHNMDVDEDFENDD